MYPRGGRGTERSHLVLHHSIEVGSNRKKCPVKSGYWSVDCSAASVRFNGYKSDYHLLPGQRCIPKVTGSGMCANVEEMKPQLRGTS